MDNNDTEINLKKVGPIVEQKNVPSIGESMGRLMMEVNQRMLIELQWSHLLKSSISRSIPEGNDVIEIDPQDSLDLPTIELLEKELNQPTIENNVLELKSLELSKDSYAVSNDNLTIYNDQTSK